MYKSRYDLLKKYIKLRLATPSIKDTVPKTPKHKEKRAIFIGSPVHSNLGDQLIASESIKYIETLGFEKIVEVPEFSYEIFASRMKLSESDVIFISGGGWMGDLYEDELVIEEIIQKWNHNRIIILPQTIYFGEGRYSSVSQLSQVLDKHNDLILCVRDSNSFRMCIEELGRSEKDCLLLPDMALLALSNVKSSPHKKKKVFFSIREDAEKNGSVHDNEIYEYLERYGYACEKTSTVLNKSGIGMTRRDDAIRDKIKEFSQAELIITDRLHSMIFSLLSGTKCIAIDNLTHKVSGVASRWLNDYPGLIICSSWDEVSTNTIDYLLNSKHVPVSRDFSGEMAALTRLIRR